MDGECCPEFEPERWDGKVLEWKEKKFVKGRVLTLFYMPINFGGVISRLMKKIDAAKAECRDWLALSDHTSMWKMDLYVAVDREIPYAENTTISGKFLCKVYEGPYSDAGKWCRDFAEYAKGKGLETGKMYMWYTTCPKCAKKYGKNCVVIIAEIISTK